jgi:hypothetical protein
MKQNQQSSLEIIVGLVILSFLCFVTYFIFKNISDTLTVLDPRITAAMFAASATVIVSVISVLVSKFIDQKVRISQEIRDKKIPVYEELIEGIFKMLRAIKKGEQSPENEIEDFMFSFAQQAIVWGSDSVLEAFYNFRHGNNPDDARQIAIYLEKLMLAVRKDLGHSNTGLSQGKLLGLFLNDFDEFMESPTPQLLDTNPDMTN